jgi:DNA-binding MltR family transcriptional regulator
MAKKNSLPLDSASLREALTKFTKQTDRGCALVAAAWVDDALEECVRVILRTEEEPNEDPTTKLKVKRTAEELLQPEGPLGSFASRSKMVYMLGLVEQFEFNDLDIIRRVRNDFAHVRQNLRFTDQSIKARCDNLHAAKAFEIHLGSIHHPRQKFLISTYFLTEYLLSVAKDKAKKQRPFRGDPYDAWVLSVAKSIGLQKIKEATEKLPKHQSGSKAPRQKQKTN